MKQYFRWALMASVAANTLLATSMPNEEVIQVAKLGKGTLEATSPVHIILMEGMKALYADLSAAGLGTSADWPTDDAPADLQQLRIDRSYGEPQTADGEFLQAVRGSNNENGAATATAAAKPELWESAAMKATLGVDEAKMNTVGKPVNSGQPAGKPSKPGGHKPPVDPHQPPGPGAEIPEPSTWALLLGGTAILTLRRRP
ncbi:MAG: PEP-CTERM sorting domain-containing protein [Bryobacterales bacterium]|nr:PEP-CTERM sorting domain-containing protein [Bryobacterales bacterium]